MPKATQFSGKVVPAVGLSLLESVREIDRPTAEEEELFEMDLPLSMHRRLGLSSAVRNQIRRYSTLSDREGLPADEIANLFELIGRRPDAETVFSRAGARMADLHVSARRSGVRKILPRTVRQRLAFRKMRSLVRKVSPQGSIHTHSRPPSVVVDRCLPARAVQGSSGCAFVTGAIERILGRYGANGFAVVHDACEGRAADHCSWRLDADPD